MEKRFNNERKGTGRGPRRDNERPRKPFGGRKEERQKRSFGGRREDDERPRRAFGGRREDDERPRKPFGGRRDEQERPRKPFGGRREESTGSRIRRAFEGEGAAPLKPKYKGAVEYTPKPRKPIAEGEKGVRLNKYIANSGICSRREADEFIQAGLVKVNDIIITELGTRVFQNDVVKFNDETIKGEEKVYIVMNKPKDFVTTTSDAHAEKTVMDLIAGKCRERVYPVGRLDKATTGVLLITNDGDLTERLTHPSFEKKKIYQVTLDKNLGAGDFEKILKGIVLEDGPIAADALSYLDGDNSMLGIEIHSGRNRIVRRIFESLGYKVKKLDRVYFAGLTKKNLRRGQWRFLTEQEVAMLKMGAFE